jgi:hypothetical protein
LCDERRPLPEAYLMTEGHRFDRWRCEWWKDRQKSPYLSGGRGGLSARRNSGSIRGEAAWHLGGPPRQRGPIAPPGPPRPPRPGGR